jgi:hypothetical protein
MTIKFIGTCCYMILIVLIVLDRLIQQNGQHNNFVCLSHKMINAKKIINHSLNKLLTQEEIFVTVL